MYACVNRGRSMYIDTHTFQWALLQRDTKTRHLPLSVARHLQYLCRQKTSRNKRQPCCHSGEHRAFTQMSWTCIDPAFTLDLHRRAVNILQHNWKNEQKRSQPALQWLHNRLWIRLNLCAAVLHYFATLESTNLKESLDRENRWSLIWFYLQNNTT